MSYRAIRHFRISSKYFNVGETYEGSDIEMLLREKLIEKIPDEVVAPVVSGFILPDAGEALPDPVPAPEPKSKKKKAKG